MNLLDLVVSITANDEASSKVEAAASKIKSGLSGAAKAGAAAIAAGTVAVGAGVAAIGKGALDAYASYEQLAGGVDKIFGEASDAVLKNAQEAYKTAGLSANQYMEQATSFSAALVQSMGGDTEAAAKQADVAIRAMADNVNVYGSNMEDVQNAYQGFAKQNYTMLDNLKLGYGGTQEEMERLIADANRVREANGEMADLSIESFADVVTAIQTIQEEMNIAGTTANEAATTIEGSVTSMKAAWENWLTGLGDDTANVGELTGQLVETVTTAAANIVPRVQEIISSLSTAIMESLPGIIALLAEQLPGMIETFVGMVSTIITAIVQVLPTAIQALVDALPMIIETMVTFLTENIPVLVEAALTLFLGLVTAIPLLIEQLVPVLPSIITTIITTLLEHLDEIIQGALQLFLGIITALPQFISALVENLPTIISTIVTTLIENIPTLIEAGLQLFISLLTAFPTFIGELISRLPEIGSTIMDSLGSIDLFQIGKDILNSLWDGLKSIWGNVKSWFGNITSMIPKIKGPENVDRKLLTKNGTLIMDGLLGGLERGWGEVEEFLDEKTADIGGSFDVEGRIRGSATPATSYGASSGNVSIVIEHFEHSGSEADDDKLLERIGRKLQERRRGLGLA